ncbi:peptidoglycan DD-metalloendopeptidase family protein [Hydrocarboniphaga effusa]|jgi:lipoprotein NlpD|uniref:peptidoglycan DD-metalloendopeptidase family protein n=1 Tax=Hydrocarboniphaga effusa TaxID=243629 RepID=UPI0031381491
MIEIGKSLRLMALTFALPLAGCAGMASWETDGGAEQQSYNTELPVPVQRESQPIPQRPVGPTDHLVKKGDTLYSIAFRNQLDYRELARWNNVGSDYTIYTGQVLRLTPPGALAPTGTRVAVQGVDLNETARPQALSTQRTPVLVAPMPAPSSGPVPVASSAEPFPTPTPTQPATTPIIATPAGTGGQPGWRWPVDGVVARGFNPASGSRGLDFTGTVGQPVVAASAGKVVYSGSALKGYGELVIIKHDDLHLSAYGYNRKRLVRDGDVVVAGQQIAELGVGPENKPVLHFEIRERGRPIDPVPFLPNR